MKKKIENIIVYLGKTRPYGRDDYGLLLLESIERSGYNIVGLILSKDDPVNLYPEIKNKNRFFLPEELMLKRIQIKEKLKNIDIKNKIDQWLENIKTTNADIGIVFYGNWLPPDLFNIPEYGFINYHPGPLPFLKGMEPDTFAILEGWKEIWGTVHKIEADFDTGDLITTTRKYKIKKYATPTQVLVNLTMLGVEAIIKALKIIQTRKKYNKIQNGGSEATLKKALENSTIDFEKDNNEMINRKLRAFCGQDIGIRLKIKDGEKILYVFDIETYKTDKFKNYKNGEFLGDYSGSGRFFNQPIYKTIDGVCVALVDTVEPIVYHNEWIIPPRKRKKSTSFKNILYSIKSYFDNNFNKT